MVCIWCIDLNIYSYMTELAAATNIRVGKERTCRPANPYQLPNDTCFQAGPDCLFIVYQCA